MLLDASNTDFMCLLGNVKQVACAWRMEIFSHLRHSAVFVLRTQVTAKTTIG